MAHTPGPWEAVAQVIYEKGGGSRSVAIVQVAEPSASTEANARLIAAAPDLLDALRALVTAHDTAGATRRAAIAMTLEAARAILDAAGE